MIRRIINKLTYFYLKQSIRSYEAFKHAQGFLELDSYLSKNKDWLRPHYERYVAEISSADMAASLELATFLYSVCEIAQFKKVIDFGSGFSSFILRLYAKENDNVSCYSVDDSVEWLEKTKRYLEQNSLNSDHILKMDEFLRNDVSNFDLILHDLNFVEERIKYLDAVVKRARPGGMIILDDVHKPDYMFNALKELKKSEVQKFSLRAVTNDRFGRFAMVAIRHGA